jgi:short-subunit dehydrogenase
VKNVALITGASSGIGKELAKIHASKGGDSILVARREDKLNALKEELETKYSVQAEVIVKDLTERAAAQEIYDELRQKGIVVTYLINNAGFGGRGYFHERPWEDDEAMIELNVLTLTALTRFFVPDMIQRNEGRILNVASTAGLVPGGPLQAVYYATKAYVVSFSQGLAGELLDMNSKVTVTALCPSATETEFGQKSGMDKTKGFSETASAAAVAEEGYEGMLKGEFVTVSGLPFAQKVTMSLIPLLPRKMVLKQVKQFQEIE